MPSPAQDLADYLNSYPAHKQKDPMLFQRFLDDEGIELPPEGEDDIASWVKDNHLEDFQSWLDNNAGDLYDSGGYEIERGNDHIEGGEPLGPKEWLLHFTPAQFTSFEDGVTREYLGASRVPKDRQIGCPRNLTDDPDRQKWVHAYSVFDRFGAGTLNREAIYNGPGYGHNAVLFQSDEAVVGKHLAHEEEFAFVLGCSEYNAIILTDLERVYATDKDGYERETLQGVAKFVGGDMEFDDLVTLIERLEAPEAALGGFGRYTRRPGRWHRLARKPV